MRNTHGAVARISRPFATSGIGGQTQAASICNDRPGYRDEAARSRLRVADTQPLQVWLGTRLKAKRGAVARIEQPFATSGVGGQTQAASICNDRPGGRDEAARSGLQVVAISPLRVLQMSDAARIAFSPVARISRFCDIRGRSSPMQNQLFNHHPGGRDKAARSGLQVVAVSPLMDHAHV